MTGAHIALAVVGCCVLYLVIVGPLAVIVGRFIRRGGGR